jgi:hypothetical protein
MSFVGNKLVPTVKHIKEGWETKDDSQPEGPPGKDHASCTTTVARHKQVR